MTFHDRLSDLIGQRVLVNANGFEGKYAVGLFIAIEQDFLSIQLESEAVHYPLSRVLELTTAKDGSCYMAVARNSRVEIQPDDETNDVRATLFIRLSEA